MSDPIPFSDFLAILRARGISVGLAQQQEVLRLLLCLGTTCETQVLARSLGALLGRSPGEVALVEEVFYTTFSEAFQFSAYGSGVPRGVVQGQLQKAVERAHHEAPPLQSVLKWRLVYALLALVLLLPLRYWWQARGGVPNAVPGVTSSPTPTDPKAEVPIPVEEEELPPEPPDLGPEPVKTDWTLRGMWGLLSLLLASVAVYGRRRWQDILRSRRAYWDDVRNNLPGTVYPTLRFPNLASPIERVDLEDMATLLGRGEEPMPSSELDAAKTVKATIEQAGVPSLRFARRTQVRTVILLRDLASDMRPWALTAQALVEGLWIRGVALVIRYFSGEASLVYRELDLTGPSETLAQLQEQHPSAALLVISTGIGVVDPKVPGQQAPWVGEIKRFPLRAWMNPVPHRKQWMPLLRRKSFPARVLPMTSKGLIAAAYELAMDPSRRLHVSDGAVEPPRRATEDEVKLMGELCSIMPDPPVELAEYLRQHMCPHVPVDALARLYETTEDIGRATLSFGDDQLAENLHALRARDAGQPTADKLEERARRKLLEALHASEPEVGSRAHHEWLLYCAQQQIHLHGPDDQSLALETLRVLLNGPLYQRVAEALTMIDGPADRARPGRVGVALPVIKKLREQFPQLQRRSAAGYVAKAAPRAKTPSGRWVERPSWSWPGWAEAGVGLAVLALVHGALAWRLVHSTHLPHEKAYEMTWVSSGQESGELRVQAMRSDVPMQGLLCADPKCKSARPVSFDAIRIPERKQTVDYHVRTRRTDQSWAYSEPKRVPLYVPPQPKPPETPAHKTAQLQLVLRAAEDGQVLTGVTCSVRDAQMDQPCPKTAAQLLTVAAGLVAVKVTDVRYTLQQRQVQIRESEQLKLELSLTKKQPLMNRQGKSVSASSVSTPIAAAPTGLESVSAAPTVASASSATSVSPGEMLFVPSGTFPMGSNDGFTDERPVHWQRVSAFHMDKSEVTAEQYKVCVDAGKCKKAGSGGACVYGVRGKEKHPINCVSWYDSRDYCTFINRRLPTEAEWEYVARGEKGSSYPWGEETPNNQLCWRRSRDQGTCEVGSYEKDKSPVHIMDLSGNVREWTTDSYRENYSSDSPTVGFFSVRGASWDISDPRFVRASYRAWNTPGTRDVGVGFRCARSGN